jgi:hypothetical protein
MDTLDHEIDYYKNQLTELILPATLMDCFEVFRRAALRRAAQAFNEKELSWLLLTMNEFRGADDRKEDFDLLFDPLMYTVDHPAWSAPPGTVIELPVLNSVLYETTVRGSNFRVIADSQVAALSALTDGYPDEAVIGLAEMAAAALADSGGKIPNRKNAISYLALNASARIEDYWAEDDSLWRKAGSRLVAMPDVAADLKAVMIRNGRGEEAIFESDLTCYTEDEVRCFAFHAGKFLLSGKSKHLALCGRCQERIQGWIDWARGAEDRARRNGNDSMAQA